MASGAGMEPADSRTLLLVPTASADCRRAVDALRSAAAPHGLDVVLAPPHRLEAAAAAATDAPVVLLTAGPVRALLDAMARGVPPTAALGTARAATEAAHAAAARLGGRARLLDVAAAETAAGAAALVAAVSGRDGIVESGPAPSVSEGETQGGTRGEAAGEGGEAEDADPVLGLIAAAAAAGVGDPGDWNAAFRHHRALEDEAAELAREAAGWTRAQAAGEVAGDPAARLTARVAVLEAERDRLAAEIARLEDALAEAAVGETRPRRHVIDVESVVLPAAFYGLERAGERAFRWLGREAEARIATLVPRRAGVRVDVTVEMAASRATLDGLRIGLDGAEAETVKAPLDGGRVVVSATFPGERGAPPLARRELSLRAERRVDFSDRGDPRTLAVAIGRIVLEETDAVNDSAAAAAPTRDGAGSPERRDGAPGTPERRDGAPGTPAREDRVPALSAGILFESLSHPAFHGLERRGDGLSFRWMGRRDTADIPVRLPRGRTVRVTVRLAAAIDPEALDAFTVAVDGVPAATETAREAAGGAEASALFRIAGSRAAGERLARLTLSAPVGVDLTPRGDPRRLSVAVHAVRIEAADEAAMAVEVPSPPPFAVTIEAAGLAAPAFWALETSGGRPFRWMGRSDRAGFPLVVPPGRGLAVAAEIVAAIDEAAVEGFVVLLGSAASEETVVERRTDGTLVKTALFAADAVPGGPVALTLLARHRIDLTGRGDPRTLAVALARISVDGL